MFYVVNNHSNLNKKLLINLLGKSEVFRLGNFKLRDDKSKTKHEINLLKYTIENAHHFLLQCLLNLAFCSFSTKGFCYQMWDQTKAYHTYFNNHMESLL